MAVNDAEIKIGVSLDADQFENAYNNLLSKTSKTTKGYIDNALAPENMKGAATKGWSTLPFVDMHDPASGNINATKAFMSSFAEDMRTSGIRKGSLGWQSGLLSAAYKSSIPDPMERYHKLLSEGVAYYQADEVYPTTALSKMIESDYALMEQDWSRNFIKTRTRKGAKSQYVDFAGMRDYAVEHGLGRWIDEDGGKTADNFELIEDALDGIEEVSDDVNNSFKGWGDDLKNVLGTITAIGSALIKIGSAAITGAIVLTEKSEKGVIEAGTTLDKRRAYVGMSALDELSAQVASQSVGLGKDAITNEIITMSNNREKYQLLGEGLNALYPSLTGIFDNIMSSENPMDTYKSILKEVYDNMRGADQDTRAQTLMLLESQGLGSAARVIGAMLANEGLAKDLEYDPTKLFSLRTNNYYGAFEKAETMLPDITKLNESLKASYSQLYTDFTEAFGQPFKKWWDDVLQNKVIPWFEKFIHYIYRSDSEKAIDNLTSLIDLGGGNFERNDMIELKSGRVKPNYKPIENMGKVRTTGNTDWDAWLSGDWSDFYSGEGARASWDLIKKIAKSTPEKDKNWSSVNKDVQKRVLETRERARHMVTMMQESGLDVFLENRTLEDMDKYFLQAMQNTFADKSGNWQTTFDRYLDSVKGLGTEGEVDDLILEKLTEIAKNTEGKETLLNSAQTWAAIERLYGPTVAAEMKAVVNRQ